MIARGYIPLPWTENEHRHLPYKYERFNNPEDVEKWQKQGYRNIVGAMYDMRNIWKEWIDIRPYQAYLGWRDVNWSFYKMSPATVMPMHVDTFKRFKELYAHRDHDLIMRAVVFLEDWQPGHVLHIADQQVEPWKAGDFVWWERDTPHLAANIGEMDRYTLQLTGFRR